MSYNIQASNNPISQHPTPPPNRPNIPAPKCPNVNINFRVQRLSKRALIEHIITLNLRNFTEP